MKLDIQPLDIQPIGLDIQPLDIEPLEQKSAGYGTAIKQFGAEALNAGDTAWSMLAGGLASLAGQTDDADKIYSEMNKRGEDRRKWANPDQLPLSFGEKAVGMLGTLPAQIPAALVSPFTTGKEAVDVGESLGQAQKAALVDAAGQAAGFALPLGMAGGLAKRAATGAGINAAQEVASKAAIQSMMETEEGKKKFAPNVEDAALAALTGGAFNAALGSRGAKPQEPVNKDGVKFVSKEPEAAAPVTETPALGYSVKDQYGNDIPWNQVDDPALNQGRFNAYADETGQGNLFAERSPGVLADQGPQFRPDAPVDNVRGELSNARQMELPRAGEDVLNVTPEGVAVPAREAEVPMLAREQQMDAEVARLDAEWEAARNEQFLNAEQMEMPRTEAQMDLFGDVPVGPVPRETPLRQVATQKIAEKGIEFTDGIPMRNGKSMLDKEGKLLPLFKDNKQLAQAMLEQENIASGGTLQPRADMPVREWDTWKQTFPDKVAQFVEGAAADVNNGLPYNKVMESISDPVIRKQVDKMVEPAMKAPTIDSWKPRSSQFRKQGGYVVFPGRKEQKSPEQLREAFPELFPETLGPKEWLEKYSGAKDTDKLRNPFTKGGLYQAIKTGNPLIKRVAEGVRKAEQTSQAMIRDIVHDSYAPAWRALSDKERIQVSDLLQDASRRQSNIDLASMREAGYSDKAVQVVRQHQDAMSKMEGVLGEAARANGIENVDMRTAYAASMATGDFRRMVYAKHANGEQYPVGILSANTRYGLDRIIGQYKQKDPSAIIGDERYFGGGSRTHGTQEGFSQMLEFLSKNDPAMRDFVNKVNDLITAEDFRGTKKHTMDKIGIRGMAGDRVQNSAAKNASEFADSQIRYMENVIQWNNLSKALSDAKEVMGGVEMPNAKAYLRDYIDNALGRNPTRVGKAVDHLTSIIGQEYGLGTSVGSKALSATKNITNGMLLGMNPMFMLSQVIDPFKALPAVTQMLRGRGFTKDFDFGTGYSHFGAGFMKMMQKQLTGKVDNVTQGALDYAERSHVYSSELFDHSNRSKADLAYFWDKGTQFGSAGIERGTRQGVYLGFVDMLHKNGIGPKDGLYEAAHNLTDMTMNNYSHVEAPLGYGALGGLGRMPYNLMSYKHNELSKLAMFARELPKNKDGRALTAALMSQVVFAGITGTIGFGAADEFVKMVSKMMDKPTSLTALVLQAADGTMADYFRFGIGNAAGVDLTKRLATEVVGDDLGGMLFPGGSAMLKKADAAWEAVKDPSEYNIKNAVREGVPAGIGGALDRMWFSPTNEKTGKEMATSRTTGKATAERNETDKVWKTLGGTGLNESTQKTLNYELGQTEKWIGDKRKDAVTDMQKALTQGGAQSKDFQAAMQRWIKYDGNPENLETTLQQLSTDIALTPWQRSILRNQAARSINSANKLQRTMEYGNGQSR